MTTLERLEARFSGSGLQGVAHELVGERRTARNAQAIALSHYMTRIFTGLVSDLVI